MHSIAPRRPGRPFDEDIARCHAATTHARSCAGRGNTDASGPDMVPADAWPYMATIILLGSGSLASAELKLRVGENGLIGVLRVAYPWDSRTEASVLFA